MKKKILFRTLEGTIIPETKDSISKILPLKTANHLIFSDCKIQFYYLNYISNLSRHLNVLIRLCHYNKNKYTIFEIKISNHF